MGVVITNHIQNTISHYIDDDISINLKKIQMVTLNMGNTKDEIKYSNLAPHWGINTK